jgi:hypothetical protein
MKTMTDRIKRLDCSACKLPATYIMKSTTASKYLEWKSSRYVTWCKEQELRYDRQPNTHLTSKECCLHQVYELQDEKHKS